MNMWETHPDEEEDDDHPIVAEAAAVVVPSEELHNDENDEGETMHWERTTSAEEEPVAEVVVPKPRGKPEAMAQRLAAARIQANLEELEAERLEQQEEKEEKDDDDEEHSNDSKPAATVTATVTATDTAATAVQQANKNDDHKNDEPKESVLVRATTAGKTIIKPPTVSTKKKTSGSAPRRKKTQHLPISKHRKQLLVASDTPLHPITQVEYENLEALMKQFCRVPLLAEFSRPVSLLHPELMTAYAKIVSHPIDLGHVCRGIRRRLYANTRDIRLDMWRVFANCVKFHSHPHNKEAVPSFVSIALHLREFFNNLWQEYMLPSDGTGKAYIKRQNERKKNLENSGVLVLTEKITQKTSELLLEFVEQGGRADRLDEETIFPNEDEPEDMAVVAQNLRDFSKNLAGPPSEEEYTVESFHHDLQACYTKDVLEDNPALRRIVSNRLNRLFWKLLIPLHEANSRGVTQSSIWGNLAATIWARESSKKPYWPALCLGILPPADQREGWHDAVTERNELRLPEKLRLPLETAKRKCLAAQKRQSLSYFLVEFLGTHEFIWVRETDIVENFDPENDPNKKSTTKKKKRGGHSNVVGSKNYATALEECVWANEEYESVLQDAFTYTSDAEDNENTDETGEEMNYSYSLLSASDDEADEEDNQGYGCNEVEMSMSDIEEANWLLTHDGMIDTTSAGRKNAKKRAQALKKKVDSSKTTDTKKRTKESKARETKAREAAKRKESRANLAKAKEWEREQKKELRELEKRRRKRMREREKMLRFAARKIKRQRNTEADDDGAIDERAVLSHDKRARATAIARAYMARMTKEKDYKSLALGGVLAIPAAMVDSTGMLGMALAFRAAAGEIPMPDDGEDRLAKTKPWMGKDTTTAKSSSDRAEALKQQAMLLEKRIDELRANTQRRREMAQVAIDAREKLEKDIAADDEAARRNHYKKKRKYVKASTSEDKSDTVAKPTEEVVVEAEDVEDEGDDEVVVEVESVVVDEDDDDDDDEVDASSVQVESMEVDETSKSSDAD